MARKEIDDYLQEGIYGAKELNPDEKRTYLGTYRERVILAVTKKEVRGKKGLETLEPLLQQYREAKLLINGQMNINYIRPYRELADKYNISYTYITNKESDSTYGLVLAADHAVDIKEIQLPKEDASEELTGQEPKTWWQKLFGV
ncbi:YueI family protein [Gracilibacillus alcaliphilus]|uniref:YueI family protein n=1 Tax=Gracilibacillus alcaliphilus TaxID=1401441 RepID=UPI00195BC748|nr:YueI family protein [Gracilibacillus alcaliphilus]MBM7677796.1 uncharacterized protein YueI [Gracilibacillus alcaliphilus]